jgi:hypothetical protein
MKKGLVILLLGLSSVALAAEQATEGASAATGGQSETMQQGGTENTAPAASDVAPATEAAPAEALAEQSGFSRGSVVRSVFTSAVQEREPVDKLNDTGAEQERVFYFTELRDMSGQTAIHRWEKDGQVAAEVKFDVRGPRWRVWSSKSFLPENTGEWKVSVLNGAGEIIAEETLNLTAVPAEASATTAAPADNAAEQPAAEKFEPPVNEQLMQ